MIEQIVLPADVYDTLELSAYAFGGIGAVEIYVASEPFCKLGHAEFCDPSYRLNEVLCEAGLHVGKNDDAVQAINNRKGVEPKHSRVTWEEYCAELNIVRGD